MRKARDAQSLWSDAKSTGPRKETATSNAPTCGPHCKRSGRSRHPGSLRAVDGAQVRLLRGQIRDLEVLELLLGILGRAARRHDDALALLPVDWRRELQARRQMQRADDALHLLEVAPGGRR